MRQLYSTRHPSQYWILNTEYWVLGTGYWVLGVSLLYSVLRLVTRRYGYRQHSSKSRRTWPDKDPGLHGQGLPANPKSSWFLNWVLGYLELKREGIGCRMWYGCFLMVQDYRWKKIYVWIRKGMVHMHYGAHGLYGFWGLPWWSARQCRSYWSDWHWATESVCSTGVSWTFISRQYWFLTCFKYYVPNACYGWNLYM